MLTFVCVAVQIPVHPYPALASQLTQLSAPAFLQRMLQPASQ